MIRRLASAHMSSNSRMDLTAAWLELYQDIGRSSLFNDFALDFAFFKLERLEDD